MCYWDESNCATGLKVSVQLLKFLGFLGCKHPCPMIFLQKKLPEAKDAVFCLIKVKFKRLFNSKSSYSASYHEVQESFCFNFDSGSVSENV